MILGHCDPDVVAAVSAAAARGAFLRSADGARARDGELLTRAMPSIEQVRLVSSGTRP
jgi:glutamate-1-semialdehyde 2,1-aminomutase